MSAVDKQESDPRFHETLSRDLKIILGGSALIGAGLLLESTYLAIGGALAAGIGSLSITIHNSQEQN